MKGQLVVDSLHQFRAMGRGPIWECRYRVYTLMDGIAVVLYKTPNSAFPVPIMHPEQICSELLPNLVETPEDRDRITWLINMPDKMLAFCQKQVPGLFAMVTFKEFFHHSDDRWGTIIRANLPTCKYGWFARPEWRKISEREIESIIGMPWDPHVQLVTDNAIQLWSAHRC